MATRRSSRLKSNTTENIDNITTPDQQPGVAKPSRAKSKRSVSRKGTKKSSQLNAETESQTSETLSSNEITNPANPQAETAELSSTEVKMSAAQQDVSESLELMAQNDSERTEAENVIISPYPQPETVEPDPEPEPSPSKPKLTAAQRAKIERNRQKALLLKQARLIARPSTVDESQNNKNAGFWAGKTADLPKRIIDTGAGFLLEEEDESDRAKKAKVVHPLGAILEGDYLICKECGQEFMESYLYTKFGVDVCEKCRDMDEKHKLITKTDAKNKYLLKDPDIDRREPPLRYIVKKNPRNDRWGDMKLFLESQMIERAMEVWGSEEKIEEKREQLAENRTKMKQKRFDKRVKELRKAVRSSLYQKDLSSHEHVYGPESYDEAEDTYSKTCTTCSQTISYEKM